MQQKNVVKLCSRNVFKRENRVGFVDADEVMNSVQHMFTSAILYRQLGVNVTLRNVDNKNCLA